MREAFDIRDLKFFVAVYETKGFARASIALDTVQSNVSSRIKKLEEFFSATLFERRARGIVPTAKGEHLYRYAKNVLKLLRETEEVIRGKEAA